MPGTSLVVTSEPTHISGPPERRRKIRSYLLVGLAFSGWVGFLLLAGVLVFAEPRSADTASDASAEDVPRLLVGPVIVAEPWIATAIPIQVGPAGAIPRGGWIRLDGMPALASLSAGYIIARGAWRVPVAALPALTVTAPTRRRVASQIRIALMSDDGATLTEVETTLTVMPPALCGAPATASRAIPDDIAPGTRYRPAAATPLPVLSTETDRERALGWFKRGEIHRLQGRIESARRQYEYAAKLGWPLAAMALAATFDPHEVTGTVRPDPDSARVWYERAGALMNAAVDYHLRRLGTPRSR